MNSLLQDLRFGVRMLVKQPGFTFIAVLTLALGIGVNTAIFSVVNAVLLKPLPYEQPEQLVLLHEQRAAQGRLQGPISPPDFLVWQEQNQSFVRMAAYTDALYNLTSGGEPERLWGLMTTPELLTTLGVQPLLGRDFNAADNAPNAPGSVILSHGLWQRRFGAARDIIGQTIQLNGESQTIVGVMPPGFNFPDKKIELWCSFNANAQARASRRFYYLTAVGRLKPGITSAQAQSEMDAVAARLAEQFPDTNKGHGVSLVALDEAAVGKLRTALYVLFAAVGFVLLIACANVASLSLARAATRHREMAVRASLGAGRFRLVRQMLSESLLLALAGGAGGLLIAVWGVKLLVAAGLENLPRLAEVAVDARVLVFTLIVSVLTGVVSGLLPALRLSRTDLSGMLKESGLGATGNRSHSRVRGALVVTEVALALVLLVGAGLLIKSYARLLEVEPGFVAERVLALDVSLNGERFNGRRHTFMEQLTANIAALPGVEAVGATTHLPLSGEDGGRSFSVVGEAAQSVSEKLVAEYRTVTPGYLSTMKIPLRVGRHFTARDRNEYFTADGRRLEGYADLEQNERHTPGVVIINETLARRSFAGVNPLGRRLVVDDGQRREREIIGVVGDVKHFGLDTPAKPELYLPYAQRPTQNQTLVIRATAEPTALVAAVRNAVRTLDQNLPLYGIRTVEEYLAASVAARRMNMLLIGVFAGLALLLAAVGIYGVVAHSVTERTREIGIRMALGANAYEVLRLMLRDGLKLTLLGVALGLIAALGLTRMLKSLLFEVQTTDPLTFVAVALLLTVVALLACWIPARRATKVDPLTALRHE